MWAAHGGVVSCYRKCRRERTFSATSILSRPSSPSDGPDAPDSRDSWDAPDARDAPDAPDAVDFGFNGLPSAQHTAAGIAGLVANIAGGHVSKSWCLLSDGLVKLTRANRGPGRRRPWFAHVAMQIDLSYLSTWNFDQIDVSVDRVNTRGRSGLDPGLDFCRCILPGDM
jgi:hypothetical protein